MPFTEKVKLKAKTRAAFRCCVCHKPFVEIHHIVPQVEGGSDKLSNAAPLCSSCHDLYGGNPEKRRIIRQMRDHWWELMSKREAELIQVKNLTNSAEIEATVNPEGSLKSKAIALYHVVFENEDFDTAANHLFELVRSAQHTSPNQQRILILDIDGHRNEQGGFDYDMFELQVHFLAGFLKAYLSEIMMPLGKLRNQNLQDNDLPEQVEITGKITGEKLNELIDQHGSEFRIWIADKKKWLKAE